MWHDIAVDVIGGLLLVGISTLIVFGRKLINLPRQMIINQAALFRLLRSNKLQGTALQKLAIALKAGCSNGETEEAVKSVRTDQDRTDEFFKKLAIVRPDNLEDLMKEEE